MYKTTSKLLITFLSLVLSYPVFSVTFDEAIASYEAGDMTQARSEFLKLAQLGHADSQFNLAVIFLNGQGVNENRAIALGWLLSAQSHGYGVNTTTIDNLQESLSPEEINTANSVVRQFGAVTLERSHITSIKNYTCYEASARTLHFAPINFPRRAFQARQDAMLQVRILVGIDGLARDPQVLLKAPTNDRFGFERLAISTSLKSRFTPAQINGVAVESYLNFGINLQSESGILWNLGAFDEVKELADEGYPYAKYVLGSSALLDQSLGFSNEEAMTLLLSSAQTGWSTAQSFLGYTNIERGDCASSAASMWMRHAAENGDPNGLLYTTQQLLQEEEIDVLQINELLNWAADLVLEDDDSSSYLLRHLSAILSTNSSANIRNPELALSLAEEIRQSGNINPHDQEVLASAYAANGNFNKASQAQKRAIKKAEDLYWNTELMKDRLLNWDNDQPWYGDLFIVPASTSEIPELSSTASTCEAGVDCRNSLRQDNNRPPRTGTRISR